MLHLFSNPMGWAELILKLFGDILGTGCRFQTWDSGLHVFFAHPCLLCIALVLLVIILKEAMGFFVLQLHLGMEGGRKGGRWGWNLSSPGCLPPVGWPWKAVPFHRSHSFSSKGIL